MTRVAIVTGASRGIGKQTALSLARAGIELSIAARTTEPRNGTPGTLRDTERELRSMGAEPLVVKTDLARQDDIDRLLEATFDRFGRVDIVVNNAAYTVGRALFTHVPDLSREQWEKLFAVNVTAPLMLIQGAWQSMLGHGGGVIVNVTSGAALLAPVAPGGGENPAGIPTNGPAYGTSKAALNRMANLIALEGYDKRIAVITVEPGFVLTETMAENFGGSEVEESAIAPTVPATVIAHLCTCPDPMRYTGEIISAPEFAETALKASS